MTPPQQLPSPVRDTFMNKTKTGQDESIFSDCREPYDLGKAMQKPKCQPRRIKSAKVWYGTIRNGLERI